MLSSVFRQLDLTNNRDIRDIISSCQIEVPRRTIHAPSWDLNAVLKVLCGPSYEPLGRVSFRQLTKKTLFLLALATAKRVGELHKLHRWVGFRGPDAILGYLSEFLPKSASAVNQIPRDFTVKSLAEVVCPDDEERLLCPVRALRRYLAATKGTPRPRSLFVSVKDQTKSMSLNAVSYFIRETIQQAIQPQGGPPRAGVRAHSVRGLATSLNYWKNRSLESVLEAATWKSNTVFVAHYLKDVQRTYEHIHSLGPIIAGGAIV